MDSITATEIETKPAKRRYMRRVTSTYECHRLVVFVEPELFSKFKQRCEERGVSFQTVMHEAVRKAIKL